MARAAERVDRLSLGSREHFEHMQPLADLAEAGKLVPVIDRTVPLSEVGAALSDLEAGKVAGKVVVTLALGLIGL